MADDGVDIINGTIEADTLSGLGAGDTLTGGDGDDVLYGYSAADTVAGSGQISAQLVANGLGQVLFALSAPGDPDRLFVVSKLTGQVRILDLNTRTVDATPFLDLPDSALSTEGERGLLGMAFHPDYVANGKVYLYLTRPDGDIELREFTRSGTSDTVDPASNRLILTIEHSSAGNHNGGWIGFGPDGMLYAAVGDGGGGGDPDNDAQNKDSLLGKILRIDVNSDGFPTDATRNYAIPASNPFVGAAGADEVYAYGLRNPFRASFDTNGDLYIADVGQDAREEVNVIPAGVGGLNFGWHVREGDLPYDTNTPGNPAATDPSLIDPVAVYGRDASGGRSITGGYVYHGPGGLQGHYIFADFITNNLFAFKLENGVAVDYAVRTSQAAVNGGTLNQIASFAVDGSGRLYTVGLDGEIHRLTPSEAAADGADLMFGGAGSDQLYGGLGNDVLYGEAGDDRLDGGSGGDMILGGAGADLMVGGFGGDELRGDLGRDRMLGDDGADLLSGGDDDDTLIGNAGDDTLLGEIGNDELSAAEGADMLYGGPGDDLMAAGPGADRLFGESGDDNLFGHEDDDRIEGGAGADRADGGTGADVLSGQDGNDILFGQGGADTLFGDLGDDLMLGGDANDVMRGGGGADFVGGGDQNDQVSGEDGDDQLFGNDGDDLIDGAAGNDRLDGGRGVDRLGGGLGNDVLFGQDGNDTLIGDAGDDVMLGGLNDDVLLGGDGADALFGGSGGDSIFGEAGDDQLWGDADGDQMFGGAGADRFIFSALSDSGAAGLDRIRDFVGGDGDRIDLSRLDANANVAGDQAFVFVTAFTGQAGQAVVAMVDPNIALSRLQLDVNGDGQSDFTIEIVGTFDTLSDFIP